MFTSSKILLVVWLLFAIFITFPELISKVGFRYYILSQYKTDYGIRTLIVIFSGFSLLFLGIKYKKQYLLIISALIGLIYSIVARGLHVSTKLINSIIDNGISIFTTEIGQIYISSNIMSIARESFSIIFFITATIIIFKAYKHNKSINRT